MIVSFSLYYSVAVTVMGNLPTIISHILIMYAKNIWQPDYRWMKFLKSGLQKGVSLQILCWVEIYVYIDLWSYMKKTCIIMALAFGIFTYYIKVAVLVMIDNDSAGRESLLL